MNRGALIIGGLAIAGLLVFLVLYRAEDRPTSPAAPTQGKAMPRQETSSRTAAGTRMPKRRSLVAPPPPLRVDAGPPPSDIGPPDAEPVGPFEVDLGEHKIWMKDGETERQPSSIGLRIVVPDWKSRKAIYDQRRRLIRMLFFLGSHRQLAGTRGERGKSQFEADLQERFANVIRTGAIDKVEMYKFEIPEPSPTEPDEVDVDVDVEP